MSDQLTSSGGTSMIGGAEARTSRSILALVDFRFRRLTPFFGDPPVTKSVSSASISGVRLPGHSSQLAEDRTVVDSTFLGAAIAR